MIRQALQEMERELSRRAFLHAALKGAGAVAVLDRFGEGLFAGQPQGDADDPTHMAVYRAIGNLVIPVDQDPGWATFEPEISDYGLNVFVRHVLFSNVELAFQGTLGVFNAMNEIPPTIGYGPHFLDMSTGFQSQFFGDILAGQFENAGVQDVLFIAAFLGLFSVKAVFFSNFPNHLAVPGEEFQVRPSSGVRTGWDIMGYKGPIGPEEEEELRRKFMDIEVLPGIDPSNPYV